MSEQYELARGECVAGRQRTIAAVHATSDTAHLPEEDRRRGAAQAAAAASAAGPSRDSAAQPEQS